MRCFGFISARTATLLIAFAGCIVQLHTFTYLDVLRDSFPQIPKARWPAATPAADIRQSSSVGRHTFGWVRPTSVIVLDSEVTGPGIDRPFDKQQRPGPSVPPTRLPYPDAVAPSLPDFDSAGEFSSSDWPSSAARPTRWFNLLPTKQTPDASEDDATWRAQLASQDEERRSWQAARLATSVIRVYAFLGALACAMGVYGVLRVRMKIADFVFSWRGNGY